MDPYDPSSYAEESPAASQPIPSKDAERLRSLALASTTLQHYPLQSTTPQHHSPQSTTPQHYPLQRYRSLTLYSTHSKPSRKAFPEAKSAFAVIQRVLRPSLAGPSRRTTNESLIRQIQLTRTELNRRNPSLGPLPSPPRGLDALLGTEEPPRRGSCTTHGIPAVG
ncbi:hypothetical protein KM043_003546 [Ampulex compressa]|nr:hypothetical protein KM043_003546 [Ampulex compressa]